MFRTISNFMRVGDIRRKIIFTLLMLVVFRLGTFIPVPFTDKDAIDFMNSAKCIWLFKYIWWWGIAKLLHLCHGNYALYYCINYYAITANGCCTKVY